MTWNEIKKLVGGPLGLRAEEEFPSSTIPVGRAYLCLDCERVFEASGDQSCTACGSTVSWGIRRLLERTGTGEMVPAEEREDGRAGDGLAGDATPGRVAAICRTDAPERQPVGATGL